MESVAVRPHKSHTSYCSTARWENMVNTAENCIENCICCTCSDEQIKALHITFSSSPTNAWVFVFTHFFSASGIWLWYNWHTGNILFHCARFLMQLFLVKWTHTTLDSTPKKASENLLLHIWVCIVNGNVAYKNRAGNLMLENSQRANRLQEGISGWKKSSDFLTCQKIRTQPVSVSLIK